MFRFARNREVLWPVNFNEPRDGGKTEPCTISIRYRLLSQTELAERSREELEMIRQFDASGKDYEALLKQLSSDEVQRFKQQLIERITGWEDVIDNDSGEPIPFSADALEALLDIPYVHGAVKQGLRDASIGAPTKN